MESFFIRHTNGLKIVDHGIEELWKRNRIAIHFPEVDKFVTKDKKDCISLSADDYEKRNAKGAINTFNTLNENGGYIWAEYRDIPQIKIGKIIPRSFKVLKTKWLPDEFPYERTALLKSLQIDDQSVKKLEPYEAMSLKAARLQQGALSRWKIIGDRLKCLVSDIPIPKSWDSLTPEEQETVCAEYLRTPTIDECPRLQRLLLPIGRTLKDIDIFGYTSKDKMLYAQVTYLLKKKAKGKILSLKEYTNPNSELIMFCDCKTVEYEDNILFIPIKDVEQWLISNSDYSNKIFDE